jgi:hypothetical protein
MGTYGRHTTRELGPLRMGTPRPAPIAIKNWPVPFNIRVPLYRKVAHGEPCELLFIAALMLFPR